MAQVKRIEHLSVPAGSNPYRPPATFYAALKAEHGRPKSITDWEITITPAPGDLRVDFYDPAIRLSNGHIASYFLSVLKQPNSKLFDFGGGIDKWYLAPKDIEDLVRFLEANITIC